VGVAARTVRAPDGREWQIRVHRFRPPRWRQVEPLFSEDPDPVLFGFGDVVLGIVSAVLSLVVSLVIAAVELPVNAYRALFGDERTVEATSRSPQTIRMTWRTDHEHAPAVAEQVARQLELGYTKVEPHNAVFEGFGEP
jgi:hypothetical protein